MRSVFKRKVKPGNEAFETGFLIRRTTLLFHPIFKLVSNLVVTFP